MKNLIFPIIFLLCSTAFGQKQFTISGYVSDARNGEMLIRTSIYEAERQRVTTSNDYGFYSLTLPEGNYKIIFSYIGFKSVEKQINLSANTEINVALEYSQDEVEAIKVEGNQIKRKLASSQISMETISMKTIESLPSFLGEVDIMKALQLMPGVQSGGEGTSGLYVRGGSPDQNLILLDGVPVYNASHLFGFFSVFNASAIKDVALYKGGFPARFGGRLSSVVDIRMKEGNQKEIHGGGQIGLISSKFFLEGPIKKDKTSFHVSARRTYVDLLTSQLMPEDEKLNYFFYDFNAKINHKFSERSRLYLSIYAGRDKAKTEYEDEYWEEQYNSQLYWGNITTALRWNYIFNSKLFLNTTITYNSYIFSVEEKASFNVTGTKESMYFKYKSGIEDWSAKFAFDWYINPKHEVKYGANYIYHTFTPGVETQKNNEFSRVSDYGNVYAHEVSIYAEDNMEIGSKMKANIGIHASAFNVDDIWYNSIEPRLSFRYLITNNISFKLAYSKMQQYLHLLSNSTIGLPTDLWLPSTKKIKPQISQQYAAGVVYGGFEKIELSAEAFYKEMNNIIEYKEGASFFSYSTGWENQVEAGFGQVYGIELMARKDIGKTTGWMAYTWSKNERKFDNINFGKWFPTKYDRRHDVSIVATHKFNNKIDIGATWVYGTGNAMSLAIHEIEVMEPDGNIYGNTTIDFIEQRNNYRMPAYHRLDLAVNFNKQKKHGTRTWNVSIYNVYNRKNPFFLYLDTNNDGSRKLNQISLFPIIPSVSYIFKF